MLYNQRTIKIAFSFQVNMTYWRLLGIIFSLCVLKLVFSLHHVINSPKSFIEQLCKTSSNDGEKVLALNSSIVYDLSGYNGYCIINNSTITIFSETGDNVEIYCTQGLKNNPPTGGVTFINSTVTLRNVIIMNCGAPLTALPSKITEKFNSSSFYYPRDYATVLLFVECVVNISNVKIITSYGFPIIGINLCTSVISNSDFHSFVAFKVNIDENKTIGNGILLHFLKNDETVTSSKSVVIENSNFIWNSDHSKNHTKHCIADIFHDRAKSPKPIITSVGVTIIYTGDKYPATVRLMSIELSNNIATFTTSLLILHYHSHQHDRTEIVNSKVKTLQIYNKAVCPESAEFTFLFFSEDITPNRTCNPLVVDHTEFRSQPDPLDLINYESLKSSVYIGIISTQSRMKSHRIMINFTNTSFHHCVANGYAGCLSVHAKIPTILVLNGMSVYQNTVKMVSQISSSSGVVSLKGYIDCIINGTKEYPSVFFNNRGRVIHGFNRTNLYLHGHVIFDSNRARSGAAISLQGNSQLWFMKDATVLFEKNQAIGLGGAIYAANTARQNKNCALHFEHSSSVNVTFINNFALQGGSNIYAYPIFNCYFDKGLPYKASMKTYEKIFTSKTNSSKSLQLSTFPSNFSILHFNESGTNVYPGQAFFACITATDVLRRKVYAIIRVIVLPEDIEITTKEWIRLGNNQQTIQENQDCTNISVRLHSTAKYSGRVVKRKRIMFYLEQTAQFHISSVLLHTCPYGFQLDSEAGACTCSQVLKKLNIKCSIQSQTFNKLSKTNQWVGEVFKQNQSMFAVALNCPNEYCLPVQFNWFYSNDTGVYLQQNEYSARKLPICIHGREGPLCSQCSEGLTSTLGSAKCIHCNPHTYYWVSIIVTAFVGPMLILILYALKLTLTVGTINGIIFYANFINTGLLNALSNKAGSSQGESILNDIMLGFLSILNLDYGHPVCFLKHMSHFWRAGLKLVFPYYLLSLVGVIILVSRCSLWVSKHTSHSSLQVLVTVVHLSFSNLLLQIVIVFSSTVVYTDNEEYRVWSFDGSVPFLKDVRHQILATVLSLGIFPLLFSYLFFLLFTKQLMKFSSKCNLYLRPIYETIHAPYKEGKEYWFAMRLLVLVFTCIFWSFKTNANSGLIHIVTAILLCVFLMGQALFHPYKSNKLSLLDNWTLLNLLVVYISLLLPQGDFEKATTVLSVATTLIFITTLLVIIYHFLWVTKLEKKLEKKLFFCKETRHYRFQQCPEDENIESTGDSSQVKEQSHRASNTVLHTVESDGFYESCEGYREPLLDNY